jgi:hypothetical protein
MSLWPHFNFLKESKVYHETRYVRCAIGVSQTYWSPTTGNCKMVYARVSEEGRHKRHLLRILNWCTVIHGVHCAGLSDFSVRGAPAEAFFSATGAALSQEAPTVKWMSNQPALWTPDRSRGKVCYFCKGTFLFVEFKVTWRSCEKFLYFSVWWRELMNHTSSSFQYPFEFIIHQSSDAV